MPHEYIESIYITRLQTLQQTHRRTAPTTTPKATATRNWITRRQASTIHKHIIKAEGIVAKPPDHIHILG
jgi:hypothetical protein